MSVFYRSMRASADGGPLVGNKSMMLGVRVDGDYADIVPDEGGFVRPETGGLSISPGSVWNIPAICRPKSMGRGSKGRDGLVVYEVTDEQLTVTGVLTVRHDPKDPEVHAFVEPARSMPFPTYETALVQTRPHWATVKV